MTNQIDWLRCVGKTVIISIDADEDNGVYAQKIAVPIVAVIELETHSLFHLITSPLKIQGEDVSEKTTIFTLDTTGVVRGGTAVGEAEEKYWVDISGMIVEVY
jgi:hypothetical protein